MNKTDLVWKLDCESPTEEVLHLLSSRRFLPCRIARIKPRVPKFQLTMTSNILQLLLNNSICWKPCVGQRKHAFGEDVTNGFPFAILVA